MFDWLFEGYATVYILSATVALALLFLYWQHRRNVWLYAMTGVVALIGVYWLLDRLVETDQEQIQRKLETMAAAVRQHNANAVFEQVSDNFRSPGGNDKDNFRKLVEGRIDGVQQLTLWDYRFDGRPERGKDYTGLRFRFKLVPTGLSGDPYFDFAPIFTYDPQKGWQLKGFKILQADGKEEFPVPF